MSETLRETADAEARKAEEDFGRLGKKERAKVAREKAGAKPNGKANGVTHEGSSSTSDEGEKEDHAPEEEPAPKAGAQPSAQGSATQGDDDAEPLPLFTRHPTPEQVKIAKALTLDLSRKVHGMAMDDVIQRLLQVVDIDPALTMPETWQHGEERYAASDVLEKIGSFLMKGCRDTLELTPHDVSWFWRNSKRWEKRGVVVIAEAKVVPTWARTLTDGVSVIVHVNYRKLREMNHVQKIKAIYHVLRGLDADAKRVPPHFSGWADELEHFGPLTFAEEVRMVNAIDRGRMKRFDYQLSLLEEPAEAGAEA